MGIAQLGEHQIEDLKVTCLIHGHYIFNFPSQVAMNSFYAFFMIHLFKDLQKRVVAFFCCTNEHSDIKYAICPSTNESLESNMVIGNTMNRGYK